jgi:hypothetical protein
MNNRLDWRAMLRMRVKRGTPFLLLGPTAAIAVAHEPVEIIGDIWLYYIEE